jgi:hypothetical protein
MFAHRPTCTLAAVRLIVTMRLNGVDKPMNNSEKTAFLQSSMNIMKSRSRFVALRMTP